MASKKPDSEVKPITVFGALSGGLSSGFTQAGRVALTMALRQDVADVGELIRQEAQSQHPSLEYLTWQNDLRAFSSSSSFESYRTRAPMFLRQEFPQANALIPLGQVSKRFQRDMTQPEVMLVPEGEFMTTLRSSQGAEAASAWLADVLVTWDRRNHVSLLHSAMDARIGLLLDHANPNRVFVHTMRLVGSDSFRQSDWLKKKADAGEPTFIRLQAFVSQHLSSSLPQALEGSGLIRQEPRQAEVLPSGGAVEQFFAARAALTKRLKMAGRESVSAEWLNRPQVWSAVRSIAMQGEFIESLIRKGALKAESPAPEQDSEETTEPSASSTPALIASLDLPTTPKPVPVNLAKAALLGYFQSINDKNDLAAVVTALTAVTDVRSASSAIAAVIDERSAGVEDVEKILADRAGALRFSLADALLMLEEVPVVQHKKGWWGDIAGQSLLKALGNETWTVAALNDLWTQTPASPHSQFLMPLTLAFAKTNPNVWADLSEEAVTRVAISWPYASSTVLAENNAPALAALQGRIVNLPLPLRAEVLNNYLNLEWSNEKGRQVIERATAATLAAASPDELTHLVQGITANGCTSATAIELVSLLNKVSQSAPVVAGVLRAISISIRYPQEAVNALGKLLGYSAPGVANENDKAAVLACLTDADKKKVLGVLSAAILQEVRGQALLSGGLDHHRFRENEDQSDTVNVTFLKNMAFDLVEALPDQPVMILQSNHRLVKCGFADVGETLTWEGLCQLMAPYLQEPRPDLQWSRPVLVEAQDRTQTKAVSKVLDRQTVLERLQAPPINPRILHGAGHHRFRHEPIMVMETGALEDMFHHVQRGGAHISSVPPAMRPFMLGNMLAGELVAGTIFADKFPISEVKARITP